MSMESGEKRLEAEQNRIRHLIESGEAVDEKDAEEALREENDTDFLRGVHLSQYREEVVEVLRSQEIDPADRWDFKFRKAVIDVAETPDELEFLWYQALLDLPLGKSADEAVRKRNESTKRRLEHKTARLVERIGDERAKVLFGRYRALLQELFNEA